MKALMIAGLVVALAPASGVSGQDDHYGEPVADLQLGLDLRGGKQPSVATLQDLELDLFLRNQSRSPLPIALPDADPQLTQGVLFGLELKRGDGLPASLPRFELGGVLIDAVGLANYHAEVHLISGTHRRSVALRDWFGWQGVVLEPGDYQMRAMYRGMPDPENSRGGRVGRGSEMDHVWKGEVYSRWLRFTVLGIDQDGRRVSELDLAGEQLVWGEPQDGLRAALFLDPPGHEYFLGESPTRWVYLENVSDQLLYLDRVLPFSDEDGLQVEDASGTPLAVSGGVGFKTGWRPAVRWWLARGQLVKVFAGDFSLRAGAGGITGSAGSYALRVAVAVRVRSSEPAAEGVPWPGYQVTTGPWPLQLRERR